MRLARVVVGVLALVACAWFALGVRQAHDLSAAQAIAGSSRDVSAAQAARARSLLDGAATLNPDRAVTMTRAQLALRLGNAAQASRLYASVVRAEPKNIVAWLGLSEASYGKRDILTAVRKLAALDPLDTARR